MALAIHKRGRAASQQELTTAITPLTTVSQLTQHGQTNGVRASSVRHLSFPAHQEQLSPRSRRRTAHSHLAANAYLRPVKQLRVQGYRRPPVDATTTPVLSDAVPACLLRARTPGAPPATFCPPGPKQNTSSDRANLWTNHRICSTPRASTMPWRILLPKWAIARARGKLEARLCAVVRGGGTMCLETKVLLLPFFILNGKVVASESS